MPATIFLAALLLPLLLLLLLLVPPPARLKLLLPLVLLVVLLLSGSCMPGLASARWMYLRYCQAIFSPSSGCSAELLAAVPAGVAIPLLLSD